MDATDQVVTKRVLAAGTAILTCALDNKLARLCYATLHDGESYGAARLQQKVTRTAFALPA